MIHFLRVGIGCSLLFFCSALLQADDSVPAPIRDHQVYSWLRIGAVGSGGGGITQSVGMNLGLSLGYQFQPNFSAGIFYDFMTTFNPAYITINLAGIYGVEGGYTVNPESRARFLVGAKFGRIDSAALQWVVIPVGAGGFSSWLLGPKLGFLYDVTQLFSIGTEASVVWVFSGTANTTSLFAGSNQVTVPGFALGNLSMTFGFHF